MTTREGGAWHTKPWSIGHLSNFLFLKITALLKFLAQSFRIGSRLYEKFMSMDEFCMYGIIRITFFLLVFQLSLSVMTFSLFPSTHKHIYTHIYTHTEGDVYKIINAL